MKYKILAVDMDGTLLNDNLDIQKENLDYIRKAKDAGVKFVLCSGRIPGALKYYINQVSEGQPVICCNGGIILNHEGEKIYSKDIEKSKLIKAVKLLKNDNKVLYHIYHEDVFITEQFENFKRFYNKFNNYLDINMRLEMRLVPNIADYIQTSEKGFNKLMILCNDHNHLDSIRKLLSEECKLEITKSSHNNLEVMECDINKGNAIKKIADYYNITLDECIAVGNDENDISMIKTAGIGVAVKNASTYVKSQADYITENDNNNAAIKEVIERFILN